MIRLILKSKKGQTAVEYVLMLAVGASIGLTAFKKLNEYLLTSPNSIIGKPLKKIKDRMNESPRYERTPFAVRK